MAPHRPTDSSQPTAPAKTPKPTKADQMTPELLEFIQAVLEERRVEEEEKPAPPSVA
mgnify:CR=1 FL=1